MSESSSKSRLHTPKRGDHVVYPDVESVPTVDSRTVAEDSPIQLQQVEVLSSVNRGSAPDLYRSAPVDDLVQSLAVIAEDVETVISDLPTGRNQPIELWCELHHLDSTRNDIGAVLARQAVFYLWLKATLYEWYSRYGELPKYPADPRAGFREARRVTGCAAFDECALDEIAWLADDETLTAVFEKRGQLLESSQPAEDIGRIYGQLLSAKDRRSLGQVRTPPDIVDLLRSWVTPEDEVILDPGLGAGGLSSPFHPQWTIMSDPTRVFGVERSPLAHLMGMTALTIARQPHEILEGDFLDVSPEELGADIDVVIANPPYTRHQDIPSDTKAAARAQVKRETGLDVPSTTPLYAYFLYHARQFLDPGNRAAFITPQAFLAAEYGTLLKEFLLEEFDIKAFVLFNPENGSAFENALATGLVTFLEVTEGSASTSDTRFIRVDEPFEISEIQAAVEHGQCESTDWGVVNCLSQDELRPADNWQSLFEPIEVDVDELVRLAEVAEVSRGLSTGENDFFCLSQSAVDVAGIDEQYLSKLIRSPRYLDGYDVQSADWERLRETGVDAWLLYHVDDVEGIPRDVTAAVADTATDENGDMSSGASALARYLRAGQTGHDTLSDRSVLKNRSQWYRVERRAPATILIPSMGRGEFKAMLNETAARHLNNIHGVYPDSLFGEDELKALLAYLNSRFLKVVVQAYGRTYAGGLDKFEPGDLEELPVINPRELPRDVVRDLSALFDALRAADREGDDTDVILRRIDSVLRAVL